MKLSQYCNDGFDRGAGRAKEFCWLVVKAVFFLIPLPLPSAWRVAWLRLFGATVGRGVVVRSGVNITFPWRVTIGNDVWIGENVTLLSLATIVIEADVCLSHGAYLCTGSHDFGRESFDLITRPIMISTGSWIAARAFIGPGVTVARAAMVTACSVATGDVPACTIVRGNPAIVIKELTSPA